jgi:putative transposase
MCKNVEWPETLSVYPGKASEVAPNLLRELTEGRDPEVVFSDILEGKLADGTKVRGCFALWQRPRPILGLAFEDHLRAELVAPALQTGAFEVPDAMFQSDQGKQCGAQSIRESLLKKACSFR